MLIRELDYKSAISEQPKEAMPTTAPASAPTFRAKTPLERLESISRIGKDPIIGAAKSVGYNILGAGELGQKIFNPWSWFGSEEAKKSQEFARDVKEKYTTPENTGEAVGFIGGQIVQALLPGAKGFGGLNAARGMVAAPRAARVAGAIATEVAPQTLLAASGEGEFSRNALLSGVLNGIGAVGGKVPNALLGLGQVGAGIKQIGEGDIAGGAMNIGFGALGARSAVKTPGLLVNKAVIPPSAKEAAEKYAKTFSQIVGPQMREAKIVQQKRLKGMPVKTADQIAAEHAIAGLDTDANGRLVTDEARKDISTKLDSWENLYQTSLDDEYQRNSITKLKEKIQNDIKEGKASGIKSATDRKAAIADIDQFFADELEAAQGDLVTDRKLNEIKRGLNSAYREGAPRLGYEAQRYARSVLADELEQQVTDVNVKKIGQVMGELLDLDRVLKNANGKAIKGGRLTRQLNSIVGSIVGGQFGPVGSLVGAEAGMALTDYANDPYRRMVAERLNLDLSGFTPPSDQLRTETKQALQNRLRSRLTGEGRPLALPEPSAIYAPTQSSGGSRLLSQQEAVDRLRELGTLPTEEQIKSSLSGTPLQRMEILQKVRSFSEQDAARVARREMAEMNRFSSELESGYSSFKSAASRSPMMLDEAFDASSLERRLGPKKYREIIASSGSDLSDDEILTMFKSRLVKERNANELRNKQSPYELFGIGAGLEVEQGEDGSLEFKGFDPTKAAMGVAGVTFTKKFKQNNPPRIPLATQKEMVEIIDYARLKPGTNQKMEDAARALADKFGVETKTLASLANVFDGWLSILRTKKGYESLFRKK